MIEEAGRLSAKTHTFVNELGETFRFPPDWSVLLVDYTVEDMISAGFAPELVPRLFGDELTPREKWTLAAPAFGAVRQGGYARAVDLTTERLLGLRLSPDTVDEISEALARMRRPGYYVPLLREHARVSRCQVNSMEVAPFCETATPDLLEQDLGILPLVFGSNRHAESLSGIEVSSLQDYLDVVAWIFDTYARRATAMKCQWAYQRPLALSPVKRPSTRAFAAVRNGQADDAERRTVEDFLFRRCVDLATEHGLPVKLHLGHLAGNGLVNQRHVYDHVRDVAGLVQDHPSTTFVLMHMAWPQQHELLALAKHQPNVMVDLCWSWIVAPLQTRTFVKHFLTSAPANKLLCFGGDYLVAENIVGHAELARRGLQKALDELIADDWLTTADALALVPALMHENAERALPSPSG